MSSHSYLHQVLLPQRQLQGWQSGSTPTQHPHKVRLVYVVSPSSSLTNKPTHELQNQKIPTIITFSSDYQHQRMCNRRACRRIILKSICRQEPACERENRLRFGCSARGAADEPALHVSTRLAGGIPAALLFSDANLCLDLQTSPSTHASGAK